MLNHTVLVGRIIADPEVKELESGKKITNLTLAIPRSYKNMNGEYETDFVDCKLWNGIAQNVCEYCKKGDLVGIKGRIQTEIYEVNGDKRKSTTIIAEKVTFLSSQKSKSHEDEMEV